MGFGEKYWGPSDTQMTKAPTFTLEDYDQDFYRTQQILYGHSGWLNFAMGSKWGRNSLNDVLAEFYLMQSLQSSYLKTSVQTIEYYNRTSWFTLSQALVNNYNFYSAKVRVTYQSGLIVVADAKNIRKKLEFPGTEPIIRSGQLGWFFQYANDTSYTDM
jgi:hypothetical protein